MENLLEEKDGLTDKLVDKMQNYGKAIRENKENLEGMKTSIKAIQHHIIKDESLPLDQQHYYCPKLADTWCKSWQNQIKNTSLYNEDNRLLQIFMKELDSIFKRLSKDDLLQRCLKGMTQNQNEAANGICCG